MEKISQEELKLKRIQMNGRTQAIWNIFKDKVSKYSTLLTLSSWAIICLFPFFWSLFSSFNDPYLISHSGLNPMPSSWTFENYEGVFSSGAYSTFAFDWIKNSIIFSFTVALLNSTLNLLAGYALAKVDMAGKKVLTSYFLITILIPGQATFIPTYMIFSELGLIGNVSNNQFLFSVILISATSVGGSMGARQFFYTQSNEMEEAGRMEGLSSLSIFIRITLRKMAPLWITNFVGTFMASWNIFILFHLYSSGDPEKMTLMSGVYAVTGGARDLDIAYGRMLAISNVSMVPMIVIYALSLKIQLRGIKGGNK